MDGSRVMQSLDSLWFYTNILTCRDEPVASLTDQFSPLIHAQEPPKSDSEKSNSPFLLNQPNESEKDRVIPVNMEMLAFGRGAEKKDRRRRRKRRSRSGLNGMKNINGGLELGFDGKVVSGSLKFEDSCGIQRLSSQLLTRMLPYHDDIAMKEHLKSWAHAVACTVK